MRAVKAYPETWPLQNPFVLAREHTRDAVVVVVEIEEDSARGTGECTPDPHYGETEASVLAQIASLFPDLEQGMTRQQLQTALPAGAARNAIDSALWDLESDKQTRSLWQLTGTLQPPTVEMMQTVSVDIPENMAISALALWQNGARLLKIKMDNALITERLIAIRAAVPQATLIVDAHASWSGEGLAARCQLLADLGVAMLIQPLPAAADALLQNFIHPLPICADESCHTRESLPGVKGHYEMIMIKLDKTGGLTEALALAAAAEATGLGVTLGCKLCTSRAINAALPLVQSARFVDLDGPTWLAADVEPSLTFSCGRLTLSTR